MDEIFEHILVIDDDAALCALLSEYLKPEGFQVEVAHSGEKGVEMALAGKFSLIVLDVMLPGKLNGFDVLRNIRHGADVPILMLSARGEDVDRIVGLEMGADDYMPKPFNPRELLARIRTILRRSITPTAGIGNTGALHYKVGCVELDTGARLAYCSDNQIELTSVEFALLEIFLKNAGRVLTREELTQEVLGRELSPYDRSIDVHVSKLRKKLGGHSSDVGPIKSVRGAGYIYTMPAISPEIYVQVQAEAMKDDSREKV